MIKFYHYSSEKYDDIKSKLTQDLDRDPDIVKFIRKNFSLLTDHLKLSDPYAYNKHISLMFEPIPIDLASIFESNHEFWKKGSEWYEHTILLDAIPDSCYFKIAESPEKTNLILVEQNWDLVKGNPKLKDMYLDQIMRSNQINGYIGSGKKDLLKAVDKIQKQVTVRDSYVNANIQARDNGWDVLYTQYAGMVPHIGLYTNLDSLSVHSVKKIRLK